MRKTLSFLGMAVLLTACGHSSEPDYFLLNSVPGNQVTEIAATIRVERPVLPDYLNRPDFVSQTNTNQIVIDGTNNWGEPLDAMFGRILASDLQQRLPSSVVLTEDNPSSTTARFSIGTTVERFNPTGEGKVTLTGEIIIKDKVNPQKQIALPVQQVVSAGEGPTSVSNGLSQLTADYADEAVTEIIHILNEAK